MANLAGVEPVGRKVDVDQREAGFGDRRMRLGGEADDLDAAVLRFGEGDGLDVIHPLNLGADQHHRASLAEAQVVVERPMRLKMRGKGRAVVLTQIGLLEA